MVGDACKISMPIDIEIVAFISFMQSHKIHRSIGVSSCKDESTVKSRAHWTNKYSNHQNSISRSPNSIRATKKKYGTSWKNVWNIPSNVVNYCCSRRIVRTPIKKTKKNYYILSLCFYCCSRCPSPRNAMIHKCFFLYLFGHINVISIS